MRQLHPQAARDGLRLCEHLLQIVDRPARHAGAFERVDPVALRALRDDLGKEARQLGPVLDALAVGHEARIVGERAAARDLAELAEQVVVAAREDHVAVGGLEDLVGHDVGVLVAQAPGRLAGGEIVRALVGEHRDQRIEQREIEMLARAALRARCASAAQTATLAYMPVIMSAIGMPAFCGPPPGRSSRSPVMLIRPPMPWIMKS